MHYIIFKVYFNDATIIKIHFKELSKKSIIMRDILYSMPANELCKVLMSFSVNII